MKKHALKAIFATLAGTATVGSSLIPASVAMAAKPFTIAFIPGVAGDAYYGSLGCGIQAIASQQGAKVVTQAPRSFDPVAQIPILNAVVAQHPDAIVIAPTDSKALVAPLRAAAASGIKIVLADTTLDDTSFAAAEVSADNKEAGAVAGRALADLLHGRAGSVITVNLSPGVTTTDARETGFASVMKATKGIDYLPQQFSNNSVQKADQIVSSTALANPNLVGVFSTAAFNTEGTVAALRASGKSKDVIVVGFDANPPGIDQLRKGTVAAQVVLKPYDEGRDAAEQALNALNGRAVTKKILTTSVVATRENLDQPDVKRYIYSFECPGS
jgi:ribose transport system substrate-binding protein